MTATRGGRGWFERRHGHWMPRYSAPDQPNMHRDLVNFQDCRPQYVNARWVAHRHRSDHRPGNIQRSESLVACVSQIQVSLEPTEQKFRNSPREIRSPRVESASTTVRSIYSSSAAVSMDHGEASVAIFSACFACGCASSHRYRYWQLVPPAARRPTFRCSNSTAFHQPADRCGQDQHLCCVSQSAPSRPRKHRSERWQRPHRVTWRGCQRENCVV